jgi:hypothetical protein
MLRNLLLSLGIFLCLPLISYAQSTPTQPSNVSALKINYARMSKCTIFTEDGAGTSYSALIVDHPIVNDNPNAIVSTTIFQSNETAAGSKRIEISYADPVYLASNSDSREVFYGPSNCPAGKWILRPTGSIPDDPNLHRFYTVVVTVIR